ncbi:ATP-binding protein [Pseudonocardia dioxanivorans]|uniref:ATP-binding protein n=1 Tax=Pseudonocardia dioxanivorans TaxID=240495 RepID=UPI001F332A1C|nr:LuxR C-terminal-related transcriptional regulator [Pseudonocardia dioxanivorans]
MLPRPSTSFVGREGELARARALLLGTRLLTLTGPGGCGKTRMAIELAGRSPEDFPDGVHFVSLAAVRDPALVPVSTARGIGLQDARGTPLLEHLSGYLSERDALVILDNMEQVLAARGFVADLLAATTRPRILVTSRSPLHLSWEQEFPVPALGVPPGGPAASTASVAGCESVRLFVARAAASAPGFTVTGENAAAVAGIAERLEGLPLAIELAAARVKVLEPAAILARLEDSLGLLVGGRRDAPDRHRALRATILWSHELLSEAAKALLAVCSVFRGGIDLAVLEGVCREAVHLPVPVLDALTELVDHSLVRADPVLGAAPRFAMLETVREFAAEQLVALPGHERVRAAHAAAFRALAEGLARPPAGPDRVGLDLLEREHDNFRAALDHYGETEPGTALRLANRLTAFWSIRGHFSEGRRRLGELLARVPDDDPERVDALNGAAWLATDQGDGAAAVPLLDETLARARAAGDRAGEATVLYYRGRASAIAGDPAGRADIERALELQLETGDDAGIAAALWLGGAVAILGEDHRLARERLERCVALCEARGLPAIEARARQLHAMADLELGDLARARAVLTRAVPAVVDLGDRFAIAVGLSLLAGLAARTGRPRVALRLAGAAAAYEEVNQTHRPQNVRARLDAWLEPARATVGAAAAKLVEGGRGMTVDQAVALGLADAPEDPWRAGPGAGLTRREREIAALVATGMTNREIAGRLQLSVRTVEVHVDHALTKLGLRTRTQLAAWLHQDGLAPGNT